MARVHFLNVGDGDCIIIEHASGRITMMDICSGNLVTSREAALTKALQLSTVRGNFRMCQFPNNPIDYLRQISASQVFRFILSHPDMDHMDGFDNLFTKTTIVNYWDSGVRKPKPDFAGSPYNEADWDRHIAVRDGQTNITALTVRAGNSFRYANKEEDGSAGGDGLHILAPSVDLVQEANESGDPHKGACHPLS